MSEGASQREWRFYINDMIGFCERILAFTKRTGRTEFPANAMRYDATVRKIELVGEATTYVPNLFDGTTRRFLGAWSSPRGTS